MPALPPDEIVRRLGALAGWEQRGDEIVKTFELATFAAAIDFVVRIAERAEAADHHPDIDIRYRKVTVALTTHDQGGLTNRDFALAGEIEATADGPGSGA